MSDEELNNRHARNVAANLDIAPEYIRVCPECGRTVVLISVDGNPVRCTCESRARRGCCRQSRERDHERRRHCARMARRTGRLVARWNLLGDEPAKLAPVFDCADLSPAERDIRESLRKMGGIGDGILCYGGLARFLFDVHEALVADLREDDGPFGEIADVLYGEDEQ